MSNRLPKKLWEGKPDLPINNVLEWRYIQDLTWLREDINLMQKMFIADNSIHHHHLEQFKVIVEKLPDKLMEQYEASDAIQSESSRYMFKSLIVGVLVSQWIILRDVVQQRLPHYPYYDRLHGAEKKAVDFYNRLYAVLPIDKRANVSKSPPIVFVGKDREVAVFNQRHAPAIISVPFEGLYPEDNIDDILRTNEGNKVEQMVVGAVAHETGHAIFTRLPAVLEELNKKVEKQFENVSEHEKPILKTILGWLEEMIADCTGTALEGVRNGDSAIWVTIGPVQFAGIGSDTHPPFPLRPISHWRTLVYLAKEIQSGSWNNQAAELKNKIDAIYADLFLVRFESIQALDVVTLDEVRLLMIDVLDYILEKCKLSELSNKTLGEFLVDSVNLDEPAKLAPFNWGNHFLDEDHILDIPAMTIDHYRGGFMQNILSFFGLRQSRRRR